LERQAAEECNIRATDILNEIACVAFIDPINLFDDNGDILPINEMDERTRRAIASLEIENVTGSQAKTKKIKLWPKPTALEQLSKYRGLFARDNDQRNPGEFFVRVG